jgi:ABC-2 type transport system permease protein
MHHSIIIAKKEFKDILHSRIFLIVLILLLVLTISSVVVASLVFNSQVSAYHQNLEALKLLGKQPTGPPPALYPLNLLRGAVDYLEIVGAILGILLGCLTIAKEKNTQSLKLILTRPIRRGDILLGKMLGNAAFIAIVLGCVGIFITASLMFVAGSVLSTSEIIKLILVLAFSWVYIMAFFSLATFLTLRTKTLAVALTIAFTIWLVFVLVLPQIGDTMDPDNQIPGGFFSSIHFNKQQEKQVLTKFSFYENTRDFVEELSVTKH